MHWQWLLFCKSIITYFSSTWRDWSQIFNWFFVYMSIIYGFIHSSLTKTVFVTQLRSDLSNPWLYQENKFNSLLFKKLFWELHLQKLKGVFLIMISIFMWPESCTGKELTLLQFQHQNTNFTLSWPWICFETTSPV